MLDSSQQNRWAETRKLWRCSACLCVSSVLMLGLELCGLRRCQGWWWVENEWVCVVLSQNKNTTVFSCCVLLFVWTPGLCLDGHFLTFKPEVWDRKLSWRHESPYVSSLWRTTQVILLTHYIQEKGHLETLPQFSVAKTHLASWQVPQIREGFKDRPLPCINNLQIFFVFDLLSMWKKENKNRNKKEVPSKLWNVICQATVSSSM